ncbi:TIGR04211 family SH3 domain-containing protein [Halomonas halocynthiae]|uniref:TIGR04211 family SH3 domain-containing protein n=1 Tax=Halomonas halocynthiae TaxID=176290 RepID=UPI00048A041D
MRQYIKTIGLGMLTLTLALPLQAQQDSSDKGWVSDEITTFVRSGPTDGYRIVGRLEAGAPVTVLEVSGDYTHVRSESGDEVWVPSSDIQQTPSAQARVPELEARVDTLTSELAGINSTWDGRLGSLNETLEIREKRIAQLETQNNALATEAEAAQARVRQLEAHLNTEENDLLMRYFMYGGGVAGAGLVLGLIVPHLPRRRRRSSNWF